MWMFSNWLARTRSAITKCGHNLGRAFIRSAMNFAFPKSDDFPASVSQPAIDQAIARAISLYLCKPVRLITLVLCPATCSPSVTVPKFAVTKYCDTLTNNDEIRFPESPVLFAVPDTSAPESLPQPVFDLRADRADSRHCVVNLRSTRRSSRPFLRPLFQRDSPL
jgi:hypothetical protein